MTQKFFNPVVYILGTRHMCFYGPRDSVNNDNNFQRQEDGKFYGYMTFPVWYESSKSPSRVRKFHKDFRSHISSPNCNPLLLWPPWVSWGEGNFTWKTMKNHLSLFLSLILMPLTLFYIGILHTLASGFKEIMTSRFLPQVWPLVGILRTH